MYSLLYPADQIWLRGSLLNGQSFAWRQISAHEYCGVIRNTFVELKQELKFGPVFIRNGNGEKIKMLHEYFRMDDDANAYYREWTKSNGRFAKLAKRLVGIRILDQDPMETLFSFLASQNNNIPRISSMLKSLRQEFGEPIENSEIKSFPTVQRLAMECTEERLRQLGFGYRAKYVVNTAKALNSKANLNQWISDLRDANKMTDQQVREQLLEFDGIGPKVADCVALFGFNRLTVVPVDVHVFRLAKREFEELRDVTNLNGNTYKQVQQAFVGAFGAKAGWAHSVLFTAELHAFRDCLDEDMIKEMDEYKKVVGDEKKVKKNEKMIRMEKKKQGVLEAVETGSEENVVEKVTKRNRTKKVGSGKEVMTAASNAESGEDDDEKHATKALKRGKTQKSPLGKDSVDLRPATKKGKSTREDV